MSNYPIHNSISNGFKWGYDIQETDREGRFSVFLKELRILEGPGLRR